MSGRLRERPDFASLGSMVGRIPVMDVAPVVHRAERGARRRGRETVLGHMGRFEHLELFDQGAVTAWSGRRSFCWDLLLCWI